MAIEIQLVGLSTITTTTVMICNNGILCETIIQSGAVKKVDHYADCEHNLRKILLNNGFVLVE